MLLPLAAGLARDLSIENHLALAVMRGGHGTQDTLVSLMRVVYMTYHMLNGGSRVAGHGPFLEAEAVLDGAMKEGARSGRWELPEQKWLVLAEVLLRFDAMVTSAPRYRYGEAWEWLGRFVRSPRASPLPGSRLEDSRRPIHTGTWNMTKTYRELLAELRELDARIAAERDIRRNGALETIRALMTEFRITPEELMVPHVRESGSQPRVKYRDPVSGATWSGRGRAPAWIAGRDRDAFAV